MEAFKGALGELIQLQKYLNEAGLRINLSKVQGDLANIINQFVEAVQAFETPGQIEVVDPTYSSQMVQLYTALGLSLGALKAIHSCISHVNGVNPEGLSDVIKRVEKSLFDQKTINGIVEETTNEN